MDVGAERRRESWKGKAAIIKYKAAGGVGILEVILRISAAAASLGATITMATTQQTLPFFTQFFQFQATYDDLPSFTFFVIAMSIVTGYLVLSLPFSIVCIARPLQQVGGPRLLLILCDTLTVGLANSAASSSAAIVYVAQKGNWEANWLGICQQFNHFCHRATAAVVASFITVAMLLFLLILSALALIHST